MGSSMRPKSEPALSLRAAKPSSQSLRLAITKMRNATMRQISPGMTKAIAKTGTSRMRMMVRALGKAIMDGSVGGEVPKITPFWLLYLPKPLCIPSVGVEEVEDFPRQGFAHPRHRFEVGQAGRGHCPGRAEMLQQGALAASAHSGDLVQGIGANGGATFLPVAADGKAVGFVAQPLQVIE